MTQQAYACRHQFSAENWTPNHRGPAPRRTDGYNRGKPRVNLGAAPASDLRFPHALLE